MAELAQLLSRGGGRVPLRSILDTCETRTEIVVLFLAVLELLKVGRLWAEQGQAFAEIVLVESLAEPA
jgi:chromatin segregation and condensation protein Rec8/ScpA/Scc1 (kleisin family)